MGEGGGDEKVSRREPGGHRRCKLTSERVDDQTKDHGEHGDEHPVGELLVLHAAVDGYAGFMALQANTRSSPFTVKGSGQGSRVFTLAVQRLFWLCSGQLLMRHYGKRKCVFTCWDSEGLLFAVFVCLN